VGLFALDIGLNCDPPLPKIRLPPLRWMYPNPGGCFWRPANCLAREGGGIVDEGGGERGFLLNARARLRTAQRPRE
jgi:hypothetical protein